MLLKNTIFLLIVFNTFSCSKYSLKKDKYRGEVKGYYEIECQSTYNSPDTLLNSKIEGYVIDGKSDIFINGCFITLEDRKLLAKTDSLGYFEVILKNGYYKFKFVLAGNHTLVTDNIELKKNTTTKILVKLGSYWIY